MASPTKIPVSVSWTVPERSAGRLTQCDLRFVLGFESL